MTEQYRPISDEDLHAYVDGQLEPARRTEVENYLTEHPEVTQLIADYQQYNLGLHKLFDPTLDESIPKRLTIRPRQHKHFISLAQAASVILALTVGVVFGWISRGEMPSTLPQHKVSLVPNTVATQNAIAQNTMAMMNDAFASHAVYTPEVRHPVEVTSDEEQHLYAWLSKRLDTNVRAPALNAIGYKLLGGRLLTSEGVPAAQFMYENASGQRLTLFTRHKKTQESQTAFRFAAKGKIQGFYWIDGDLAYALIGEIDRDAISNAAHIVYQELNQ